jgi:hypothetical protein
MNAALRKLAQSEPHGRLATESYLRFTNLVIPGVISAHELRERLLKSCVSIPAYEAEATIARAFAAAKGKTHEHGTEAHRTR